jgi:hypothetical protein
VEHSICARAPSWLWAIALSLLCVGASVAITELLPVREGELLALRWLRIVAGHPMRSALALALVFGALAPGARPPPAPPPS